MSEYRIEFPLETREVDASLAAAEDYRAMLDSLEQDGLPQFEQRFKAMLNENIINEIANFQSQLRREEHDIRERIEEINRSLREIDYNPGRLIQLEAQSSGDGEIAEFRASLRACTEGSLSGSGDEQYAEGKFLEVRRIIERFRGREGLSDRDRRWTRKVCDVRNWFGFSASERWREDGSEHEHYSDSGGKSGGQKEKLAYTVLAASLAYRFGSNGRDPLAFVPLRGDRRSLRPWFRRIGTLRARTVQEAQPAVANRHPAAEDPHHRALRRQRRLRAQRAGPRIEAALLSIEEYRERKEQLGATQ